VFGQQERQGGEQAHHHPTADRQHVHVPRAQMGILRAPGEHQQQARDTGDGAGPGERRQVLAALENQQREHRHQHAQGQGDEENPDDETDHAQGRQGHGVGPLGQGGALILPMARRM
jgi:hypothetical protein